MTAPKTREPLASNRTLRIITLLLILLIGGLGLRALTASVPRSPEQRQEAARDVLSGVRVAATVVVSSLAAASAIADFGIEGGVRLVRVRIIDELHLELRIETARDVAFASPPEVCLVGPYSAPDDAGLSDRCWGEPDLGALVAAKLATDGAGHPALQARRSIVVDAPLRRGQVRCDYPPGDWRLEVVANPLIDGSAVGAMDLPDLVVQLPYQGTTALPLLPIDQTRYCGLATVVYLEQGEPRVSSP